MYRYFYLNSEVVSTDNIKYTNIEENMGFITEIAGKRCKLQCISICNDIAIFKIGAGNGLPYTSATLTPAEDGDFTVLLAGSNGCAHTDSQRIPAIKYIDDCFKIGSVEKVKKYRQVRVGDVLQNNGKSGKPMTVLAVGNDGALFCEEENTNILTNSCNVTSRIVQINSQQAGNLGIFVKKVQEGDL